MKKIDKDERIRRWINLQYIKVKNLAAVGSIILLAFNLALSLYPFMQFRFPAYVFSVIPTAWLFVSLIFVILMLIIWFSAHIYVKVFEMYRTEKSAEMKYNPYAVYAFTPFQEAWFRNYHLPILKSISKAYPDDKELKETVTKIEKWLLIGYIPKDEFPADLQDYYLTDIQRRV